MSDLDLPALIGGRYRPLRLIGRGGMGAVYEVEHTHTGQHLALKILSHPQHGATAAERFKREARATSSIQSEHIVRVVDADVAPELGGAPYLVMELLEGADLDRVSHRGPVPPEEALGWLRQVARALDKAHAVGIVHRDLKPANLFLTQREDGSPLVKILDFGIAKMAAEATLTQSDNLLGTPAFMAPEQTESKGSPVTFQSDLYALGLISFRLLVGRNYWKEGSLVQVLSQVLVEPMPPPSGRGADLGPAFDEWFLRACDRDPKNRFKSAHEQVEALGVALALPEQRQSLSSWPRGIIISTDGTASAAPSVDTLGTAETLKASATEVKSRVKRSRRRRWLVGALSGAVAAIGLATALGRSRAPVGRVGPRAPADVRGIPTLDVAPGRPPAKTPPATSFADASGVAFDGQVASPSASGAVPIIEEKRNAGRPVPVPSGGPREKRPPASPPYDSIWTER